HHGRGHASRAVRAHIAADFATARAVADMHYGLSAEPRDQRFEVVGVGVQLVAVPGLARAAVAAAVMGDAAVAAGSQKEHLVFPGVRAQRPAMTEDHGLSTAPVLVVQLDGFGIFFTDSNVWYIDRPFCVCVNLDVGI